MKPLQKILAKFSGRGAIKALRVYVDEIKQGTKLAIESVSHLRPEELQKRRATFVEGWRNNPNQEAVDALVAFEAYASAAASVFSALYREASALETERLSARRDLFESALAEIEAGYDEQRAAIVEADAKRSAELGVRCVSTEALRVLDRMRENLEMNLITQRRDLPSAINAVLSATTPPPVNETQALIEREQAMHDKRAAARLEEEKANADRGAWPRVVHGRQ